MSDSTLIKVHISLCYFNFTMVWFCLDFIKVGIALFCLGLASAVLYLIISVIYRLLHKKGAQTKCQRK